MINYSYAFFNHIIEKLYKQKIIHKLFYDIV